MSRKSELRLADYLQHILDAIERIEGYLASGDEQSFMQSFMAQDAVIRNLEVIGEAAINLRSLDPAAAAQYPAWDQIRGMRVTVGMIVGQIGAGRGVDELLAECPYLEREDILQALRYAAWRAAEREVVLADA